MAFNSDTSKCDKLGYGIYALAYYTSYFNIIFIQY